mmetsp:Transcript_9069/g.16455  ORF Transcript_9069/g.16455 Transcript_9069/m.16455 type:complete len:239 (-) Transcript_9069:1572-2288(-)
MPMASWEERTMPCLDSGDRNLDASRQIKVEELLPRKSPLAMAGRTLWMQVRVRQVPSRPRGTTVWPWRMIFIKEMSRQSTKNLITMPMSNSMTMMWMLERQKLSLKIRSLMTTMMTTIWKTTLMGNAPLVPKGWPPWLDFVLCLPRLAERLPPSKLRNWPSKTSDKRKKRINYRQKKTRRRKIATLRATTFPRLSQRPKKHVRLPKQRHLRLWTMLTMVINRRNQHLRVSRSMKMANA